MVSSSIQSLVLNALKEDVPHGDITSLSIIPARQCVNANIIFKASGIVCGMDIACWALKHFDAKLKVTFICKDGTLVKAGQKVLSVTGDARSILRLERVLLNIISHLSGIATLTRTYVDAIKPYKTAIMDTRKTMPLLRELERYAVRVGGGVNHRLNLSTAVMIKDNHRVFFKGTDDLVKAIHVAKIKTKKNVIVEVDSLEEFKTVLLSKADVILLDNMTPKQVQEAVALRKVSGKKVLLEVSGGINLTNIRLFAKTGIERISIGALTHSRKALDVSLEMIND